MTYNAEKNLTLLYVGGKNSYSRGLGKNYYLKITHTHLPYIRPIVKSTIKGVGKKWIWHISKCRPSTKWLARVNQVAVFKTKVLHLKIENTPIKDTNGKRKFNGMLNFVFCGQTKASHYEIVLRRIQPCFYTADRSAWLVLNQPRPGGFWRNLKYILYSMVKELSVRF